MSIRKAFKMKVHKGKFAEYEKRHQKVFPDLLEAIKKSGAKNYSIFLDEETGSLFAYVELDCEEKWNEISSTEACKRWWKSMKDIMETNGDSSPKSKELKDVFYLK